MRVDSNDAYIQNQCSLVVRIDGNEIEVPITFGMSADEIRALYPFLLPLLNRKIENPAIQFNRNEKRGMYANLDKDEYDAELCRTMAQSKFWYDKTEAGLLDIAVRFALDIEMKGINELSSMFTSMPEHNPIKLKPVSEAEAHAIMQTLLLEERDRAEPLPRVSDIKSVSDDLSDVSTDAFDLRISEPSHVESGRSIDAALDEAFKTDTAGVAIESLAREDLKSADASNYESQYKAEKFSDDEIDENGLLRRDDRDIDSFETAVSDGIEETPADDSVGDGVDIVHDDDNEDGEDDYYEDYDDEYGGDTPDVDFLSDEGE